MQKADDPNINFGAFPQPFCSQHVVSFQTSATTSGSGGMPVYLDCSNGMDMGMLSTARSAAVSTSSSNMVADSGQNLKYGGPLAADWSYLELQVLKDGLEKYVNEQGLMKYIKIAASLPTKTVRDVAMRCQWLGDKIIEPSLRGTNHPVQTDIRVSSFVSHNAIQNNQFISGASEIDRTVQHILEENNRLLNQIETNILTFQAQNNIDLFHRARRNINGLLQTVSQMPGMMSKMPALPEVDENLASYVLSGLTMAQVLGSGHLKEEPRGW